MEVCGKNLIISVQVIKNLVFQQSQSLNFCILHEGRKE